MSRNANTQNREDISSVSNGNMPKAKVDVLESCLQRNKIEFRLVASVRSKRFGLLKDLPRPVARTSSKNKHRLQLK